MEAKLFQNKLFINGKAAGTVDHDHKVIYVKSDWIVPEDKKELVLALAEWECKTGSDLEQACDMYSEYDVVKERE